MDRYPQAMKKSTVFVTWNIGLSTEAVETMEKVMLSRIFFNNDGATEKTWFYRLDMPSDRKHFSKTKPMERKHFAEVDEWWNNRVEIKDADTDSYKSKAFNPAEFASLNYNFDQCGYPHKEEEILAPKDLINQYEEERKSLNAEIDRVLAEIMAKLGAEV